MRFAELYFGSLDSGYVIQSRNSSDGWVVRTDPTDDLDKAKELHIEINNDYYPDETRLIKITYEIIEESYND